MTTCYACGAHVTERASRGPLMTQVDPPAAYWRGVRLPITSNYQLAILHLLCSQGKASHLAMQIVGAGDDTAMKTVEVQLFRLRRQLPSGVAIENIFGWGYRINVEEESMKDKLREAVDALPDDGKGAVLLYGDGDGKVHIITLNVTKDQTLQMLGIAVTTVGTAKKES